MRLIRNIWIGVAVLTVFGILAVATPSFSAFHGGGFHGGGFHNGGFHGGYGFHQGHGFKEAMDFMGTSFTMIATGETAGTGGGVLHHGHITGAPGVTRITGNTIILTMTAMTRMTGDHSATDTITTND